MEATMLLQRGKFIISNINELSKCEETHDGIKRVIDLAYMGKFEYEGNTIPISRMFMEYYKDKYIFYPVNVFNQNNEQMYIYANSDKVREKHMDNYMNLLAYSEISRNFSLWEYINHTKDNCLYDLWWNVESDYLIFFGDEKKEIINYFINSCYIRDGEREEIGKKLVKVGYKLQ